MSRHVAPRRSVRAPGRWLSRSIANLPTREGPMFTSLRSRRVDSAQRAARGKGSTHRLRLHVEPLEDRSLPSTYAITDIGVAQFDHNAYPGTYLRINNATTPQVIGASLGGLDHQHAFVWDDVHGRIDLAPMGHDNFTAANGLN